MNKITGMVLAAGLLSLGACGQQAKKEKSETAGLGDYFRGSSSSFGFNLANYISSNQSSSPLAPFAKNGSLILGNKSTLAVENNLIVEGSQSTGKISSNYFLNGYALNNSFSVIDARIITNQRPLAGSYSIRSLGNTVKEGAVTSKIDYQTVRDYTIAIPAASLSAVGFYGEAGIGGEVKLVGEPAVEPSRDSTVIRLAPSAALYSKLELGASVIAGVARAGLQGNVRMFEVEEPVYAELGVNARREGFGIFQANAIEVNSMGGQLQAIATVGVNSLLPESMQNLWKQYLEKSWKWDVLTIEQTRAASIQGTSLGFGSAN